jgi:hypothetical protein
MVNYRSGARAHMSLVSVRGPLRDADGTGGHPGGVPTRFAPPVPPTRSRLELQPPQRRHVASALECSPIARVEIVGLRLHFL